MRSNNLFYKIIVKIIAVSTKERYDSICESFTGRDISLGNYHVIQVDDISSYGTRVESQECHLRLIMKY